MPNIKDLFGEDSLQAIFGDTRTREKSVKLDQMNLAINFQKNSIFIFIVENLHHIR